MKFTSVKSKLHVLCCSSGSVYEVKRMRDRTSNDLLLVKTSDLELVILVLNILIRSGCIRSISAYDAKNSLAFILGARDMEEG